MGCPKTHGEAAPSGKSRRSWLGRGHGDNPGAGQGTLLGSGLGWAGSGGLISAN